MKRVLLLLAGGFEVYEASVFTDVIGWNLVEGGGNTELVTCGLRREISSAFGLEVVTGTTIGEVDVDDFGALAIPGGFEEYGFYEDAYDERFLELIREFHRKDKFIASVCVAALPIGKSGILRGKNATTYNLNRGVRMEELRKFGVNVVREPLVVDGKIVTSWNPSTAMNVAFTLLEFLTSRENAAYIREIMGFS